MCTFVRLAPDSSFSEKDVQTEMKFYPHYTRNQIEDMLKGRARWEQFHGKRHSEEKFWEKALTTEGKEFFELTRKYKNA